MIDAYLFLQEDKAKLRKSKDIDCQDLMQETDARLMEEVSVFKLKMSWKWARETDTYTIHLLLLERGDKFNSEKKQRRNSVREKK